MMKFTDDSIGRCFVTALVSTGLGEETDNQVRELITRECVCLIISPLQINIKETNLYLVSIGQLLANV